MMTPETKVMIKASGSRVGFYSIEPYGFIYCMRTLWLWHSQFAMDSSTMLLSSVNHLYIKAIYTMAMLNNQMVLYITIKPIDNDK